MTVNPSDNSSECPDKNSRSPKFWMCLVLAWSHIPISSLITHLSVQVPSSTLGGSGTLVTCLVLCSNWIHLSWSITKALKRLWSIQVDMDLKQKWVLLWGITICLLCGSLLVRVAWSGRCYTKVCIRIFYLPYDSFIPLKQSWNKCHKSADCTRRTWTCPTQKLKALNCPFNDN